MAVKAPESGNPDRALEATWSLYLIRIPSGALYTGIATDVARRLAEHTGGKLGAKYLRSKGPLDLVYQVELGSRATALRAELRVKKLTKAAKEALVRNRPGPQELLDRLRVK